PFFGRRLLPLVDFDLLERACVFAGADDLAGVCGEAYPMLAQNARIALTAMIRLAGKRNPPHLRSKNFPLVQARCAGCPRPQLYGSVPERKMVDDPDPRPWRTRKTTSCPLLSWLMILRNSSSLFTG